MIELPIRVAAPDVTHLDALACGTRLGEFEILGLIGVGGFGMVYRAYDHSLQRDVAIKEYMPSSLASRAPQVLTISVRTASDQDTFQAGLQSFVGEARMLARFEHPSLVKVFRFWEANNTAYMVMPLYRGMTLKQARLRMRAPPSEAWLRKVLWSILGAIKVLHRGTALHRDISPDNIFLQDAGPPVLLDLGAARLAIGDRAKQHTAILKVNFAPIEQYADIKDMGQGPWTDLYSLAAVVYGLLCNDPPLPATIRVVNDSMPALDRVVTTIAQEFGQSYSQEFVTSVAWAFNIRPQDRPQSVQEFARALRLATPGGMSSFDWRAELGAACLPGGEVLQVPDAAGFCEPTRLEPARADYLPTQRVTSRRDDPGIDKHLNPAQPLLAPWTAEETQEEPDAAGADRHAWPPHPARDVDPHAAQALDLPGAASPGPASLASSRAKGGRSYGLKLALSALALMLMGVAAWGWYSAVGHRASGLASAPAMTPAAVPGSASLGLVPVAPAPPMAGSTAASQRPAASMATGSRPAASTPLAAGVTPLKTTAPRRVIPVAQTPAETPGPPPRVELSPAQAASQATSQAASQAVPLPSVAKPEVRGLTAEKLCADSNFLTRPMCMYRACQRPGLAASATCVELEQALKRDAEVSRR